MSALDLAGGLLSPGQAPFNKILAAPPLYRKLVESQVALTDDERDRLKREYDAKSSSELHDPESCVLSSSWSAASELTSRWTHADKLAHKRALRIDTVDKEHQSKLKVMFSVNDSPSLLFLFTIVRPHQRLR